MLGEARDALQEADGNPTSFARARCGRHSPEVLTRLPGSLTLPWQK
jgi:hypothetical protein